MTSFFVGWMETCSGYIDYSSGQNKFPLRRHIGCTYLDYFPFRLLLRLQTPLLRVAAEMIHGVSVHQRTRNLAYVFMALSS
jgi:hypothetical protein